MSNLRNILLAGAFALVTIPTALADTGTTWVGGEIGFTNHPVPSTLTREQVRADLMKFQREGGQLARGEFTLIPQAQSSLLVQGDPSAVMGNAAAPTPYAQPTRSERDPYFNGGPN